MKISATKFAIVAAMSLLLCTFANAQSIEEMRLANDEGRYLEAADMAEEIGTSESYALGAEALAVYGFYRMPEEERRGIFKRARAMGERAVELDVKNPQAHLQLAHAIGRYAESAGSMVALREGLLKKMRTALEEAIFLDPKLADAHLMLASWHAEAVDQGGAAARLMFGANNRQATAHYNQAVRLAPDSKNVLFFYARGLLMIDEKKNRTEAKKTLIRAKEIPASNAYEEILDELTEEQLAALSRS